MASERVAPIVLNNLTRQRAEGEAVEKKRPSKLTAEIGAPNEIPDFKSAATDRKIGSPKPDEMSAASLVAPDYKGLTGLQG